MYYLQQAKNFQPKFTLHNETSLQPAIAINTTLGENDKHWIDNHKKETLQGKQGGCKRRTLYKVYGSNHVVKHVPAHKSGFILHSSLTMSCCVKTLKYFNFKLKL